VHADEICPSPSGVVKVHLNFYSITA